MPCSDVVRVAIVGAGWMGQLRARALREIEKVEVAGAADLVAERAVQIAGDKAAAFANAHELITKTKPHAVIVATPEGAHHDAAIHALRSGAHVLVEKPMATNVNDCDAMLVAAAESGRTLMIGHTLRFDPRYALAAERVRKGEIGECIHAFCRRNNTILSPTRLNFCCSVLQFLAIHEFDWLLWTLNDRPVSVFAAAARKKLPVDDTVFTTIRFASGAVAMVESSWVLPEHLPQGLHAEAQVVGAEGAVFVDGSPRNLALHTDQSRHIDFTYTPVLHGHSVGAAVEETRHFIRCVRDGEKPPADGCAGRAAVEVMVAAQLSIDEKREIEIPQT